MLRVIKRELVSRHLVLEHFSLAFNVGVCHVTVSVPVPGCGAQLFTRAIPRRVGIVMESTKHCNPSVEEDGEKNRGDGL